MDSKTQAMFFSWTNTDRFKTRIKETQEEMMRVFSQFNRVSLSVSGGKDSLVMLHLALQVHPTLFVWHYNYGQFMIPEFEQAIIENLKTNFSILPGHFHTGIRPSNSQDNLYGYRAMFGMIYEYEKQNNIDLSCLGFRAEESCFRKTRCKQPIERKGTHLTYFPMRKWTYKDIWGYILKEKIAYPVAYDIRAPYFGWDKIRFVSFFDPEFDCFAGNDQDKFFFWQYRTKANF